MRCRRTPFAIIALWCTNYCHQIFVRSYSVTRVGFNTNTQYKELVKKTDELIDINRNKRSKIYSIGCDRVFNLWTELAKSNEGGFAAAVQARRLLDALRESSMPNVVFHGQVLHAYAVCGGGRKAAEAAHGLLQLMLDDCQQFVLSDSQNRAEKPCEPNIVAFNTVVNAWAKSKSDDAGEKAEEVLQMMVAWAKQCQAGLADDPDYPYCGCVPDAKTLLAMIEALSHSPDGPERAIQLVKQLMNDSSSQRSPPLLNVFVFNALMNSWASSKRGQAGAVKAEEILQLMRQANVEPNVVSYSVLMNAWAEAEDGKGIAAQRADDILQQMLSLYCKGCLDVKPNARAFTTCMKAWSRCKSMHDVPERVDQLFSTLEQLYQETGDDDCKPTIVTGSIVISLWSRAVDRPDAMERALSVLERMKKYTKPNIVCYGALMNGYASRGMSREATELLQWLSHEAKEKGETQLYPNTAIYTSVIKAHARGMSPDAGYHADKVFMQMEKEAKEQYEVKPNLVTYITIMKAWTRSLKINQRNGNKIAKAKQRICELDHMIKKLKS